jgi:outer membrane protein assembly factor BamE (lipoprotein component of BamABCDE complex)
MHTLVATILLLLTLSVAGCRQSVENKRKAESEMFEKKMEQMYAFISPGMARSNVISAFGQPIGSSTNCGPDSNWLANDYIFEPRLPGIHLNTNGFTIVYSNNVVIQKHPILSQ